MDDYGFLITSGASSDSEEDQHYYLLNNKAEIVGILRPGFKKNVVEAARTGPRVRTLKNLRSYEVVRLTYLGLSWLISSHRILFILTAERYSFYQPNTPYILQEICGYLKQEVDIILHY
jgi:hypothetical protein